VGSLLSSRHPARTRGDVPGRARTGRASSRCVGPVAAGGPGRHTDPGCTECDNRARRPGAPGAATSPRAVGTCGRAQASALLGPHDSPAPGATLGPERGTRTLPGPAPGG